LFSEPKCIGIARRPALSLLTGHDIALNRPLVVVHFVSDRRLRRDESHSSGIRFVPGNLIRFHSEIHSSKVMAKLKDSCVFLAVRDATRMGNPRVFRDSSPGANFLADECLFSFYVN
jgi:hypothetical protein